MKISCVITICDKDYKNIYSVIKSIRQNVHTEYEILIMDNRDKLKNINISNCEERIIDMGGNQFEFEARKRSLQYCTGDYIWFIDGDDSVLNSVIPLFDGDIVCFNYKLTNGTPASHIYFENAYYTENIFSLGMFEKIGNPVWAKLIKRTFLLEIYSLINTNEKINMMEDATLLILMLYKAKKIEFNTTACYLYNINTSMCEKECYDNIDDLENLFTGCHVPVKIINDIIPIDEQLKSNLKTSDLWRNNLIYMRDIFYKCTADVKDDFLRKIVKKFYSEEEISEVGGF